MSLVRIQQYDDGSWRMLDFSKVVHGSDGFVVAGKFRIYVDGEVVYSRERYEYERGKPKRER